MKAQDVRALPWYRALSPANHGELSEVRGLATDLQIAVPQAFIRPEFACWGEATAAQMDKFVEERFLVFGHKDCWIHEMPQYLCLPPVEGPEDEDTEHMRAVVSCAVFRHLLPTEEEFAALTVSEAASWIAALIRVRETGKPFATLLPLSGLCGWKGRQMMTSLRRIAQHIVREWPVPNAVTEELRMAA